MTPSTSPAKATKAHDRPQRTNGPAPSLGDRLRDARNALVGSPRFQRWASSFWLFRPVARAQERAAFDLCAGFVYSQILLAATRSGLLGALANGAIEAETAIGITGLPRPSAERLIDAGVALDLVERRSGGRIALGMRGAALMANPDIVAMVEHHQLFYRDLADPLALLGDTSQPTNLSQFWPYATGRQNGHDADAATTAAYTALMARSQEMISTDVIASYPFGRHRRLLDLGGGNATFAAAVAQAVPGITCTVLDLPAVAQHARQRLAELKLQDRVTVIEGSFFAPPALAATFDVVTLVRVLLDHDDANALRILQTARAALPPGGTLIIAEAISDAPRSRVVADAYFNFYLMAMGRGRPRSQAALSALCHRAGFTNLRLVGTPRPFVTNLLRAKAG